MTQRTDAAKDSWNKHSHAAARVASVLAERLGLDADMAYAMGLLHDIGRYDYYSGMNHIVLGYRKMMEENLPEIARICLTHSFSTKEQLKDLELQTAEDLDFVKNYINEVEYDDYDRIVQIADYMAGAHGVTTIERRFCSVLARYDVAEPRKDLLLAYDLKRSLDKRIGVDIYELFHDEIAKSAFHGIPGDYAWLAKEKEAQ